MKIFYSTYTKNSEYNLNRFEPMGSYQGIYLRAEIDQQYTYADYFPHQIFGDEPIDLFLRDFKEQKTIYQKKIFHFLKRDLYYQIIPVTPFYNHQNWDRISNIYTKKIKLKLHSITDYQFLNDEKNKLLHLDSIRLDANGLFTNENFSSFIEKIDPFIKSKIEYLEDPGIDLNWNNYPVSLARDFLEGSPFQIQIYKPNRAFFELNWQNEDIPIIFSSYQGSDLGRWHCYGELLDYGNLELTHGIADNSPLFDFENGHFFPNRIYVKKMYEDLTKISWNYLCTL